MKKIIGKALEELLDQLGLSEQLSQYNLQATPVVLIGIGIIVLFFALLSWLKYRKLKDNGSKMYLVTVSYLLLIGFGFIGFGVFYFL